MATTSINRSFLTRSQVLSIVGQETRMGKHKCPVCDEWHLEVTEKGGKVVVHCWTDNGKRHAKGEVWKHIVRKIDGYEGGVTRRKSETPPSAESEPEKQPRSGFTLADYSKLKGISVSGLTLFFDVCEINFYDGKPAVGFPYGIRTEGGEPRSSGMKVRLSENSHDTLWAIGNATDWRSAKKGEVRGVPYGLCRLQLPAYYEPDGSRSYFPKDLVICEGESDVHTLAVYNIAALGISGVNGWKPEFAKIDVIKNAERIFIVKEKPVKEGDKSGQEFVQRVSNDLPAEKVFVLDFSNDLLNVKDPSELHLKYRDTLRKEAPSLPSPASDDAEENAEAIVEFRKALLERGEWNPRADIPFLAALDAAVAVAQPFKPIRRFFATDTGNAERMAYIYGDDIRCVSGEEKFAMWDGSVWKKDKHPHILQPKAKEVVRSITPETTVIEKEGDDTWGRKSESMQKRNAMIQGLWGETQLVVEPTLFDRHLMMLNVKNGTIDLTTQTYRDFCREDYLTKISLVSFDPTAKCPKFDDFMDFTFSGDTEVIHWIDKALGYCLSGETKEQVFFICHGVGNNGKTTLIELMAQILGDDFVEPANFMTFVESRYGDTHYDVSTFIGKRMVTAVEPHKSGNLNEAILKKLTGSDKTKGRMIYERPDAFYPECKLWFAMNNKPQIQGTDEGIWRRVRFIPFLREVPKEKRVRDFHKVLFSEEGPGILNRLLQGTRDWLKEGLEPVPEIIRSATADLRSLQNVIQEFFDIHTDIGDQAKWAKAGHLHDKYVDWARGKEIHPLSSNEFAEELERRKCVRKRGDNSEEKGSGFIWYGISLKP
jgi:putative DNA primase/helicase